MAQTDARHAYAPPRNRADALGPSYCLGTPGGGEEGGQRAGNDPPTHPPFNPPTHFHPPKGGGGGHIPASLAHTSCDDKNEPI